MSQNIVEFPKPELMFPSNREEAKDHITAIRQEYCNEISTEVFEQIVNMLSQFGFTIRAEQTFVKDMVFLEETIKAFVYRYKKIDHQFHPLIEATIELPDDFIAKATGQSSETQDI